MGHISSPEQLTDYLKVTTPGIWLVLAAVVLLLAGIFVWSLAGTLETRASATVTVKDGRAQVVAAQAQTLKAGMPLRIGEKEFILTSVETDAHDHLSAFAPVDLPDGSYEGQVVVESLRPIDYLLRSR